MLTRLKVSGFKNLRDVDIRFGPFTCVAGANGSGKSNLFDAIQFLSALADSTLLDAALSVRNEKGKTFDIRELFYHAEDNYDSQMTFHVEMLVPQEGIDDLGQKAKASVTFLCYKIAIAYRNSRESVTLGGLEIIREELHHINQKNAQAHLRFPHSYKWRKSAVTGKRSGKSPLISTVEGEKRSIKLHQDGIQGGKPLARLASNLPRTVLSAANAAESPTVLLAKREMQSWRILQLEPAALRNSDNFTTPPKLKADGSSLAATLYRLANTSVKSIPSIYAQLANRLSDLIDEAHDIEVDPDEKRELLTIIVRDTKGTKFPARSLSDGTLRFLALAVLELDSDFQGLICMEEPENGIHPLRIPAMLRLLDDICTDTNEPVVEDNPLRQVIINTHSPAVVSQIPDDSLLVSKIKEFHEWERIFTQVSYASLPKTWRTNIPGHAAVPKGDLLSYLNPVFREKDEGTTGQRVIDREDIQKLVLGDRGL